MLDAKSQSQFADATAQMMRACALAATQTFSASASRGLGLWADLLRSAAAGDARRPTRASSASVAHPWALVVAFDAWRWAAMQSAASRSNPMLASWQRLFAANAWRAGYWPAWNAALQLGAMEIALALPQPAAGNGAHAFSSYRSAGGHAVAQIAAPMPEAVVA